MADKLTRVTAPNGSVLRVSAERAEALLGEGGYEAADTKPTSTAKKTSPSKTSDK